METAWRVRLSAPARLTPLSILPPAPSRSCYPRGEDTQVGQTQLLQSQQHGSPAQRWLRGSGTPLTAQLTPTSLLPPTAGATVREQSTSVTAPAWHRVPAHSSECVACGSADVKSERNRTVAALSTKSLPKATLRTLLIQFSEDPSLGYHIWSWVRAAGHQSHGNKPSKLPLCQCSGGSG